jgi:hypothetical protein
MHSKASRQACAHVHGTRAYPFTCAQASAYIKSRHGIPAMERPCKTKSWNLRLFQTVMGKVLVNGFLAFEFKTGQSQSLRNFTNVVAQRCAQTRRRRPTIVPQAGTEPKSSQEFRKSLWHHLWRGSNIPWSKGHLLVWMANGSSDHATCERRVTQLECA